MMEPYNMTISSEYISVVVPVYNSESSLPELIRRVSASLQWCSYEIILVNDGSKDGSLRICKDLAQQNKRVKVLSFYKNFGQISAIYAGLAHTKGMICVVMDDDLQNPPESIMTLVNKIEEGYDFAFGVPINRVQSVLRTFFSRITFWLSEVLFDKPPGIYPSSFLAVQRDVVKKIVDYKGSYPYLAGHLFRVTHHGISVKIPFASRRTGKSNYNLKKLLQLWLSGVTNNSIAPLRLATGFGCFCAVMGILAVVVVVVLKIWWQNFQAGWPSLFGTMVLFAGIQLLALGVIGEYLGRVFSLVNSMPQYHIKDMINFEAELVDELVNNSPLSSDQASLCSYK